MKQINIKISESAHKDLEQLKTDLNLPTVTEVIRSSLSLSKFIELQKKQGKEIIVRDPNTNKESILVIIK